MKFAPTAFVNPYEYLDTEETRNDVDRYELYMLGRTNPTYPYFKVSILGICYYRPFMSSDRLALCGPLNAIKLSVHFVSSHGILPQKQNKVFIFNSCAMLSPRSFANNHICRDNYYYYCYHRKAFENRWHQLNILIQFFLRVPPSTPPGGTLEQRLASFAIILAFVW